jgi:hypothetical protein
MVGARLIYASTPGSVDAGLEGKARGDAVRQVTSIPSRKTKNTGTWEPDTSNALRRTARPTDFTRSIK